MKILMVCLGNICRSPLAEGIMQDLIEKTGKDWTVESAGTGNWHIGSPPDFRSQEVAKQFNIDISDQRARQFNREDFDQFDIIYAMDRQNLYDIRALAKDDIQRSKVSLLLNEGDVPDPYHDDDMFVEVFVLVEEACKQRFIEIEKKNN